MQMPELIKTFLEVRYSNSNSPCDMCDSSCCNGPGFAILENVIEIYNLYANNKIQNGGCHFEKGLTLSQFIFKYFDRTIVNGKLLVFFPKMISENDFLISVPPWNFWEARDYLKKRQKSYGCIFLSKKQINDELKNNFCTLHNVNYENEISAKPIDCVFLVCTGIRNIQKPDQTTSTYWFSLLDYCFPNSIERFNQLCPDIIE